MIIEIKKGESNMTLYELLFRTEHDVDVTVQVNICDILFCKTQTCSCWLSDKYNKVLAYRVVGIRGQEAGISVEVININ